MNSGVICWRNSKKSIIADSTKKFEYIVFLGAIKKVVCMDEEIHDRTWVVPSIAKHIKPFYDDNEAII